MRQRGITVLALLCGLAGSPACGRASAGETPVSPRMVKPEAYAAFCMGVQAAEGRQHSEAVRWLQKAVALDAGSALCHIRLGSLYEVRPLLREQARKHFETALKLAPDSFRARYGVARQWLRQGQYEKARDFLLKGVDLPESKARPTLLARAYRDLAAKAEDLGKFKEAARFYTAAAKHSPGPAYLLLRLGRLYRKMGEHQKAVDAFRNVLRGVPYYAPTHRDLCDAYKAMRKWPEALEQLQAYMAHPTGPGEQNHLLKEAADLATRARLVKTATGLHEKVLLRLLRRYTPEKATPRLCVDIASALERLGRHKQAEPYLTKAVHNAKEPERPALRLKLALLYQKLGRTDDAVRELQTAVRAAEPKASVRFRVKLSSVLESAKRYDEAEKVLRETLDLPGPKSAAHAELALFYGRREKPDQAIHHLREAIKLATARQSVRYRIHLSLVLTKAQRPDDAEKVLIEARRIFPENPAINNALGWFYAERGVKLTHALGLVRKALAVSPENPYYIDSLGWIYFKQGKKKEALGQLLRAAALAHDSVICDHLGDVYQSLGRNDEAGRQWKRSLELDPKIKGVREKLDTLHRNK